VIESVVNVFLVVAKRHPRPASDRPGADRDTIETPKV
jgi:hypothetical protein